MMSGDAKDMTRAGATARAGSGLTPWNGWPLTVLLAGAIAGLSLWLAAMRGFEADGLRLAIRFTARTSLLLFGLAFAASALADLRPSPATRWLRHNRRFLGLAFAASHAVHGLAIIALARTAPYVFAAATSPASFVFGGLGYAAIVAMTVTSFAAPARWLGPRRWRRLHLVCGTYLLLQFAVSFGMRIPVMPNYVWFLLPLAAIAMLRLMAWRQRVSAAAAGRAAGQ
jgi:DMSO/TMAO reductase YedYZ heme-binding membrane subunit